MTFSNSNRLFLRDISRESKSSFYAHHWFFFYYVACSSRSYFCVDSGRAERDQMMIQRNVPLRLEIIWTLKKRRERRYMHSVERKEIFPISRLAFAYLSLFLGFLKRCSFSWEEKKGGRLLDVQGCSDVKNITLWQTAARLSCWFWQKSQQLTKTPIELSTQQLLCVADRLEILFKIVSIVKIGPR